jgi:hypothetical protein
MTACIAKKFSPEGGGRVWCSFALQSHTVLTRKFIISASKQRCLQHVTYTTLINLVKNSLLLRHRFNSHLFCTGHTLSYNGELLECPAACDINSSTAPQATAGEQDNA